MTELVIVDHFFDEETVQFQVDVYKNGEKSELLIDVEKDSVEKWLKANDLMVWADYSCVHPDGSQDTGVFTIDTYLTLPNEFIYPELKKFLIKKQML